MKLATLPGDMTGQHSSDVPRQSDAGIRLELYRAELQLFGNVAGSLFLAITPVANGTFRGCGIQRRRRLDHVDGAAVGVGWIGQSLPE